MSETSKTHKAKAPKILNFGVYICSTSRYELIQSGEKDVSDVGGDILVELLKKSQQNVLFKRIIADDKVLISGATKEALDIPSSRRRYLFRRNRYHSLRCYHRNGFALF